MTRKANKSVPRNCFTCQTRDRTEWCALNEDDLRLLNQGKVSRDYLPGDVIFREGDPCTGIYCLEAGLVGVRKLDAAGNEILLRLVEPGDTIGYRAFLVGAGHRNSAEAIDSSVVCFIGARTVHGLLEHNPFLGLQFLKHAARDLAGIEEKILQATTQPVRARFAHLMLVLKDRYGSVGDNGDMTLELPMSRKDLAAMLGVRPESLSRIVREFQDEDVARFAKRQVYVPHIDSLLDELEGREGL